MTTNVPGWAFDPALPRLPDEAPRCDVCEQRLIDLAADGALPNRHRLPGLRAPQCSRTRDDLVTVIWRLQRDAAGLSEPPNSWGYQWISIGRTRKLVAQGTRHLSAA